MEIETKERRTHKKEEEKEREKCMYIVHETGLRFGVTLDPHVRVYYVLWCGMEK